MLPTRIAFVIEQTLGHVTHYYNLRDALSGHEGLEPRWLPIPFDVTGASRLVPMLRSNWSVRASWRARRALNALQHTQPLDAIFFHTQVTSLFSRSIMRKTPTVVSLDATPINYDTVGQHYGHRAAGDSWLDRRKYELNRSAFESAAGLVAWSDWARGSLIHDYGVDPAKIKVLAPGASKSYFDVGERRVDAPRPESARVRLLFVGGDFERKGGPLLLEAMRTGLADRCELDIVTRSPVKASRNVRVHHGVEPNSPTMLKLFAEADVFVLPTLADCLGVVLMEAGAAALPLISTDIGALHEAVHHGETGLLIAPGDQRALVGAITTLLDNPGERHRMGRAAQSLAMRNFDARRNDHALLDFMAGVVDNWRAARRAA